MVNSAIHAELLKELERLPEASQNLVLNFARSLPATAHIKGTKGSDLLKFAGTISAEDAEQMRAVIEGDVRELPQMPGDFLLDTYAASVIEHDLTLVTRDAHFSVVPNSKTERW